MENLKSPDLINSYHDNERRAIEFVSIMVMAHTLEPELWTERRCLLESLNVFTSEKITQPMRVMLVSYIHENTCKIKDFE